MADVGPSERKCVMSKQTGGNGKQPLAGVNSSAGERFGFGASADDLRRGGRLGDGRGGGGRDRGGRGARLRERAGGRCGCGGCGRELTWLLLLQRHADPAGGVERRDRCDGEVAQFEVVQIGDDRLVAQPDAQGADDRAPLKRLRFDGFDSSSLMAATWESVEGTKSSILARSR